MQPPDAKTIPDLLDELAARYPEHEALVGGETRLSYRALRAEVRRLAVTQVEFVEGVRLIADIVDCPADKLRLELPVEVVFDSVTETLTPPRFSPRRS